jgi:transposase
MKHLPKTATDVYCGIDFHKNTCTLCTLTKDGKEVEPITKVNTDRLFQFLSNRKGWRIGIEASGGVNHVVEKLKGQGHEVVIINPNKFRGIGIGGKKTDSRDAQALANALRLSFVPEVHHRSRYARELKSLLTSREHIVQTRSGMMSHVRSTMREYGITMPAGAESFYSLASLKVKDVENGYIQTTLLTMIEYIFNLKKQEGEIEDRLQDMTRDDERLKRFQTAPGVGLMTALAMMAVIDDIERFANSKSFASYLGLVPSVTASANKCMMGSITRSGSEMLRRYLIHGARAWMRYSPTGDPNRAWAEKVKDRRGMNKAVVALAHRMARILYAMAKSETVYKSPVKARAA